MQNEEDISIYNVKKILIKKGVVDKESEREGENNSLVKQRRAGGWHYSICRKASYNTWICLEAEEIGNNSVLAYFN